MQNCPKCQGLLVNERVADYYTIVDYLRCLSCGKMIEVYSKDINVCREDLAEVGS